MPLDNPLREQHEKAGATLGTYFRCALPERFAETAAEYRLAREAVAVIDTSFHAFFSFTGPDRVRYLNAVLTNDIKGLTTGQGTVSLLLNPQGHILAEMETYAQPDHLLAVSHAMFREPTAAVLEKYIIMDDVTLKDVSDSISSVAMEGPMAAALLRQLCALELQDVPLYSHSEVNVAAVPCRAARKSFFGEVGVEFIAGREHLPAVWQALCAAAHAQGGGPIGYAALDALRLEAGIPWFGYDFDDKVIPHEAALETSHISYTKGCYTGQEIVERVRSRGHVNRRRVSLQFYGERIPERGAKLSAGGAEVGQVTSAAQSPALDRAIGMGYVRREHNSGGSRLQWAGGEAEVIELPRGARAALGKPAN